MPMFMYADHAIFGIEFRFSLIPELAQKHIKANPYTRDIEELGRNLIATDFPEEEVKEFVKKVCGWGGYAGIGGRVLTRNSLSSICTSLRTAIKHINRDVPQLSQALKEINTLSALGTPSFASKHLRFLCPDLCPVFDNLLREALPYSFDPLGYAAFAQDCLQIATQLTRTGIRNPFNRPNGRWSAADIEAALYTQVSEFSLSKVQK